MGNKFLTNLIIASLLLTGLNFTKTEHSEAAQCRAEDLTRVASIIERFETGYYSDGVKVTRKGYAHILALGIIRTKGPNLKKALRDLNQGLNTKWKGSQMTPVKETPEIWEPLIRLQKIISENNC